MSEIFEQNKNQCEKEATMEKLIHAVRQGLCRVFQKHKELGEAGKEQVQKNRFGETALRGDIEAEKAMFDFLKEIELPVQVKSEEHGTVNITDTPEYLALLDGLDGSIHYEEDTGRYGTMFGISKTTNPTYGDYLVSAIMEHTTGDLYFAVKGQGAWVMNLNNGTKQEINTSKCAILDNNTRILVDDYHSIGKKLFVKTLAELNMSPADEGSNTISISDKSAEAYQADVAAGRLDLVLECTRKGNLEGGIGYGLVTEAGGAVVDLQGNSLGDKKFLEFGQGKDEHLPIITAATLELSKAVIECLDFQKKKRLYFTRLGLETRRALKLHKKYGLWDKEDSWRNVSEHCLAGTARVKAFAETLQLSEETREKLQLAATLHDFDKKNEIKMIKAIKAGGREPLWDDIDKNELQSAEKLRQAGIDEDLIYLADSAGAHKSALMETTRILNQLNQKKPITELQMAYLILHYVDDYTIGNNWAEPAKVTKERGEINALDMRIDKNEANPNYKNLNQTGLDWPCLESGERPYTAQRRISHQVERALTKLLQNKTGQTIDLLKWPEHIDKMIKEKIKKFN